MSVIIIGAGAAGCEAAFRLAEAGIQVEVVEKENQPGGNLNNWYQLFPDRKPASLLRQRLQQCVSHPLVHLHTGTVPVKIQRTPQGSFNVNLDDGALLEGKALLVTTGFRTFDATRKEEYGYGIYENVITSVELENYLANGSLSTSTGKLPQRIGFIQCVGSRDEKMCNFHCSKVCCITAVKQAQLNCANCSLTPKFYASIWICECSDPGMKKCTAKHRKNTTSNSFVDDCPKRLKTKRSKSLSNVKIR